MSLIAPPIILQEIEKMPVKITLPADLPFEIVTGEVTRDGFFILIEDEGKFHVGWWDELANDWTIEAKEAGYEVGKLTPLAKIKKRF